MLFVDSVYKAINGKKIRGYACSSLEHSVSFSHDSEKRLSGGIWKITGNEVKVLTSTYIGIRTDYRYPRKVESYKEDFFWNGKPLSESDIPWAFNRCGWDFSKDTISFSPALCIIVSCILEERIDKVNTFFSHISSGLFMNRNYRNESFQLEYKGNPCDLEFLVEKIYLLDKLYLPDIRDFKDEWNTDFGWYCYFLSQKTPKQEVDPHKNDAPEENQRVEQPNEKVSETPVEQSNQKVTETPKEENNVNTLKQEQKSSVNPPIDRQENQEVKSTHNEIKSETPKKIDYQRWANKISGDYWSVVKDNPPSAIYFVCNNDKKTQIKFYNAIKYYAHLSAEEFPIILWDSTLLGSADCGFVATTHGIHTRRLGSGEYHYIPFHDIPNEDCIKHVEGLFGLGKIIINDTVKLEYIDDIRVSLMLRSIMTTIWGD